MIVVVDYGMGNHASVINMIEFLGERAVVSSDPGEISRATKLILPGVGAFQAGMENLERLGLVQPLEEAAKSKGTPVLGVCLGMHLMMQSSEEGNREGLGWIEGKATRLQASEVVKVPHMGWNRVTATRDDYLITRLPQDSRFYFVHSYAVETSSPADTVLVAHHGRSFAAAVGRDNFRGVQFHPEKSHRFGALILRNFIEASC